MEDHKYALDLIQGMYDHTIKRLFIVILVLVAVIVMLVGGFIWVWTQYDWVSYTEDYQQDGEGLNIIGNRNVGGIFDVAEIPEYNEDADG